MFSFTHNQVKTKSLQQKLQHNSWALLTRGWYLTAGRGSIITQLLMFSVSMTLILLSREVIRTIRRVSVQAHTLMWILHTQSVLPWQSGRQSRRAAVSRQERTEHAGPNSGAHCSQPSFYRPPGPTAGRHTRTHTKTIILFFRSRHRRIGFIFLIFLPDH